MITREQLIGLGRYNKPHGVNGEISATLDCDSDLLPHFSCLVSEIDGIYVPFFVTAFRTKNTSTALLTIEGIHNEREAALLVNKDVYVLKREYEEVSADEDADGFPLDFFIGFTLSDGDEVVGEIVEVDDTTDNVLFTVRRGDGTRLQVPAADDLIVDIDQEENRIEMNLPEGLLSL